MANDMDFGLLLPHFGGTATREELLRVARLADELGFDSLWARDHLIYHPHGLEDSDPTFVDGFVTLTAVGTVTDLALGTAVAIPHRHPLHLAQLYANLDYMVEGDVIAGFGLGGLKHEFRIADLPFDEREALHRENVEIMKRIWAGGGDYDGQFYTFEDAAQHPQPGDLPVWSGGSAPASVRRAWEYCDGWLPGRINMPSFRAGVATLRERAEEAGEPVPATGAIPVTSIDRDPERAMAEANVEGLLAATTDFWIPPESGSFETAEDLEGVLIAGGPEHVLREVRKYVDAGADHLVFDLRQRFDEIDTCMELLVDRVIGEI